MDDLIIKALQGRASALDWDRLNEWRSAAVENERRFQMTKEIWSLTSAASPDSKRGSEGMPSPDALIARAELLMPVEQPVPAASHVSVVSSRAGGKRITARRLAVVGMAATILIAIGIGVGSMARSGAPAQDDVATHEVTTGSGERVTVTLGDGSAVRLGPNSRLRFSERSDARGAFLEGRAFFAVRRDPTRPFTVQTGMGDAQVLGTRFEVRTDEEEFRVMVVEGEVAVAVGDTAVRVTDGELTRSRDGRGLVSEDAGSVFEELDWLGDALIFEATPLRVAVEEIQFRYDAKVVIENPALAELEITASFTSRPLEEVLLVMCETVSATCTTQADGTITME